MNSQFEYNLIDHIVFLVLIPVLVVLILAREIAREAGALPEPPNARERLHQKMLSMSKRSARTQDSTESKTRFYNKGSVIYW